jgi:protein-S-isoprenylcysteine O-methyltransferase Ste14
MAIFCFMEAQASSRIPDCNHAKAEKPFIPYTIGACILIIFWTSIYEYITFFQFSLMQTVTGCSLIVLGIFIRVTSIKKLNEFFTSHISHIKNHQLVTTGIYSHIRHPSELGLLSICFGVTILLSSMAGFLLASVVLLPLTLYRIFLEDKLLLSLFSNNYVKYKTSTPRLLPKLLK